jgi:hypothetical protein
MTRSPSCWPRTNRFAVVFGPEAATELARRLNAAVEALRQRGGR